MTRREATDRLSAWLKSVPIAWVAIGTLMGAITAGAVGSRVVGAQLALPLQVSSHGDSIRAHSIRMSGIDARLNSFERRQAAQATSIEDIRCFVRAMAGAAGAPTVDECALRDRGTQ